jgi:hypothetical protein
MSLRLSRRSIILLVGLMICLTICLFMWAWTRPPAKVHFAGYTNLYEITMASFSVSNRCSASVSYIITAEQIRNGQRTNCSGVLQKSDWRGPLAPNQDFFFNWPVDWEQGTWRFRAEFKVGPTGVRKMLSKVATKLGPRSTKRLGFLFEDRTFVVLGPEMKR